MFDRIPMWVFRYLSASDPCCDNSRKCTKLDIMCVFMIINNMSPTLMASFYKEGGQSYTNCIRLLNFFTKMKKLWQKTPINSLWTVFGNTFSYHLESKTLRQVDKTYVNHGTKTGRNEPFIPDGLHCKRQRMILTQDNKTRKNNSIRPNRLKPSHTTLQNRSPKKRQIWSTNMGFAVNSHVDFVCWA